MSTIGALLETGHSVSEILGLYPYLERRDVEAVAVSMRARPSHESPAGERRGLKRAPGRLVGGTRLLSAKPTTNADVEGKTGDIARKEEPFSTYVVRSRAYPFLVEGEIGGLPFCLVEEGETWRFVVSRVPGVDPRAVTSSRDGFIVGGWVAMERVRGRGPSMSDDELFDLIDASRAILERRRREGRAVDSPDATTKKRTRRRQ